MLFKYAEMKLKLPVVHDTSEICRLRDTCQTTFMSQNHSYIQKIHYRQLSGQNYHSGHPVSKPLLAESRKGMPIP